MKMSAGLYDALKIIAQIWLPATGTLYAGLAVIWGLPGVEQVGGTVLAVDTFLGIILGISSASYNANKKYDGELTILDGDDGSTLHLKSVDPIALNTKSAVVFKMNTQKDFSA